MNMQPKLKDTHMIVGYARTSTVGQIAGLEAQIRELNEVGCERIFQEQSSSLGLRPQLIAALEFVRENDVLIVSKLDRLVRSVSELLDITQRLEKKGVSLRIINLGIDTQTPTGKLMLTLLGGIAQFEREIMLERQREGIAKAKAEGKFRGRKPIAKEIQEEILRLCATRVSRRLVAKKMNVGNSTVYKIMKQAKGQK